MWQRLQSFSTKPSSTTGPYEKTHAKHDWWNWYAPYLSARQNGQSVEEATAAADRYMEEVHHVSRS